jgi:hypothetical protein
MAKHRGHSRPSHFIGLSVTIRKGKYKQGPVVGLWENDGKGPIMRGSAKEEYLEKVSSFIRKAVQNEQAVSFAVFESKGGGKRSRHDEDEEEDDEDDDWGLDDEDDDKKKKGKKTKKKKK